MQSYKILKDKIENKCAEICVVGLGYVGLPLAVEFAGKGYLVYGYDSSPEKINKLKTGQKYIVDIDPEKVLDLIGKKKFIPTANEKILGVADIIIVCVPTPLRKVKIPDISYVVKASRTIKKYLRKAQLVILESTSFPGTTREIVLEELKKSKLEEEKDYFLCFSPERVNPGDKKFPITRIAKVVGGLSKKSSLLVKSLYLKIIKKIHVVSCPEVAETSKLLENTFRLINIALANEFTIVCERLGISMWEVIEAAKTKPFGFMPFYPGPGTGGHCIPCDPVYLSWKAKKLGFKTRMIDLASNMNHFMPRYIVERVENLLKVKNTAIDKSKILVLGVSYKKDVKDLRESPALNIIDTLMKKKSSVDYYDPLFPYLKINGIDFKRINFKSNLLKRYDCVILATDHTGVDYRFLRENSQLIFDTRNVYKKNFSNVVRL